MLKRSSLKIITVLSRSDSEIKKISVAQATKIINRLYLSIKDLKEMSNIKRTKSAVLMTTADFIGAAVLYVMVALEVLVGDLPSKSNHYSVTFYDHNARFFWTVAGLQAAYGLYWLAGGIKGRWQQHAAAFPSTDKGKLSIDGVINIGAAICLMLTGCCFTILPIIEVRNGAVYGGQIFKNHLLSAEPAAFWQLLSFHAAVSLLPIFGSVLLVVFPPQRVWQVQGAGYNEQF